MPLTERGAEKRLSQDFSAGRITRSQFLSGVGALSKQTVGAGRKTVTATSIGLRPLPGRRGPTIPAPLPEPEGEAPGLQVGTNEVASRASRGAETRKQARLNPLAPVDIFRDAFLRRSKRAQAHALHLQRR